LGFLPIILTVCGGDAADAARMRLLLLLLLRVRDTATMLARRCAHVTADAAAPRVRLSLPGIGARCERGTSTVAAGHRP